MATFTLVITYPDAIGAEVLAALQPHYATSAVPMPTAAQIRTAMEAEVRALVRGMVIAARSRTAVAAVADPGIT